MYMGVVIMMIGVPLALGSYWGLLLLLLIIPILMWRIVDEEAMRRQELADYEVYMGQVRYRLVPFVW
jgi:protein-S-isoprenylcysteine O-methyltransferase Ste14